MITKVELNGFKGIVKTYQIDGPMLLQGKNGAGKSAVFQAIAYCLTGEVPEGKTNDAVFRFFAGDGGFVRLTDHEDAWIQRGIQVKGKKVSETLNTSDTEEGMPPVLHRWNVDVEVLDLAKFLALSPAKRRDKVLQMCETGMSPQKDLLTNIATRYVKMIGGEAATLQTLTEPTELSPEKQVLCHEWTKVNGVEQTLQVMAKKEPEDLSKCLAVLAETAKDSKNMFRRGKLKAIAESEGLEESARGARAAASEYEAAKKEVDKLMAESVAYTERKARIDEAAKALRDSLGSLGISRDKLKRIIKMKGDLKEIPDMPTPPELGHYKALEQKIEEMQKEYSKLEGVISENTSRELTLKAAQKEIDGSRKEITFHHGLPDAIAADIVKQIPDDVHPKMPELKEIIARMAEATQNRIADLESVIARRTELADDIKKLLEEDMGKVEAAKVDCADLIERIKVTEEKRSTMVAENGALMHEHQRKVKYREEIVKSHELNESQQKGAREQIEEYENTVAQRKAQLVSIGDIGTPLDDMARTATERLQEATKAVGQIEAYNEAIKKARENTLKEEAWKITMEAIKTAREVLVEAVVSPLKEDINEVLQAIGRKERAYISLHNARGTPIFDIGWYDGDTRVTLSALSGGESVIFCTALSLALLNRASGRKLLLVEADPLDFVNLGATLKALLCWTEECEALLVATASPVDAPGDYTTVMF